MGTLDGKVAIVTGASQGIGWAEAVALAREGAAVTVAARNMDNLTELAEEIKSFGGRVLPVQCDVSDKEQIQAVVDATVKEFDRIDIMVNNAQGSFNPVAMEDWTDHDLDVVMATAPYASWHFMRAVFPHMKANGGGRIINTGSAAARSAQFGHSGYAAAKGGLWYLTRTAANEWGKYNITVNLITPAAISDGARAQLTEEQIEVYAGMNPMGRFGDPETDIAPLVVFLSGPGAGYISASCICCDGGYSPI